MVNETYPLVRAANLSTYGRALSFPPIRAFGADLPISLGAYVDLRWSGT
jgi:hypothetical protein